jgi:DNA primase small subunit
VIYQFAACPSKRYTFYIMVAESIKEDDPQSNPSDDPMEDASPVPAAAKQPLTPSTSNNNHQSSSSIEVMSPQLLQVYYSRLFPFDLLSQWLHYGYTKPNASIFAHREFSFTIEPIKGEEIYLRYQAFRSAQDLQTEVLRRQPIKIDLGAVYSTSPSDRHATQTQKSVPIERELVFDIDLTDYDDIRACGCQGAALCKVCWTFMPMAMTLLDRALREDFAFQHISWFYSGRRGVHAWVCDASARELTDAGRSAVAKYLHVRTSSLLLAC